MKEAELEFERLMSGSSPALTVAAAKDNVEPATVSDRSKKAKATRRLGHNLANKAVDHYQEQGYMAFRVDYTTAVRGGALMTTDLLGFGDVMAIRGGECVLVQSTTKDQAAAHERKLCEDQKRLPRICQTAYVCAMNWLASGGRIHMALFEKDERGRWACEVREVTAEWLMLRKAKLDARRGL